MWLSMVIRIIDQYCIHKYFKLQLLTKYNKIAIMATFIKNKTKGKSKMSEITKTTNVERERSSESRSDLVPKLASAYHENWRKNRAINDENGNPTGKFEPRIKVEVNRDGKTKWVDDDKVMPTDIEASRIDIANTNYEDLPAYWQAENKAAAETVHDMFTEIGGKVNLDDPKQYSDAGTIVHEAWLKRNNWVYHPEYGNPDQAKPFDELSQELKDEDIRHIEIANSMWE